MMKYAIVKDSSGKVIEKHAYDEGVTITVAAGRTIEAVADMAALNAIEVYVDVEQADRAAIAAAVEKMAIGQAKADGHEFLSIKFKDR